MDEQQTPAPVAEGQGTIEEALAEPVPSEKPAIVRSWMAKVHQHGQGSTHPTVEQIEAAIQWALDSRFGDPTVGFTVSAEVI